MSYLQRASTAAPAALLWDREFWRSSRYLLLTLAGGLLMIALLRQLTYPRSSDPAAWLTVAIHLLVLWGAAAALRAMAKVEVDDAIARLVEQRATSELARIKGGLQDRILLDRIAAKLLPHNPSHDKGVLRLFQHILEEAQDRKFHPNAVVIQPFRDEGIGDLLRIQTIQRLALQLGILGTFAGLIIALSQMSDSGVDILAPSALRKIFDALYISFSTSVAGLEVAIILGIVLLIVRRRQEALFKSMESASAAMIALARNAINRDDFLVELEQVRTALGQIGERVHAQTKEIEVQTHEIRTGLTRLTGTRHDFDTFLERIREEQGTVLAEMKTVYQIISPLQVAEELGTSLSRVIRELTECLREDLSSGLADVEKLNTSLALVNSMGLQMKEQMDAQTRNMEESQAVFREAVSELARATQIMTQHQAEALSRLSTASSSLHSEPVAPAARLSSTAPEPALDARLDRNLDRMVLYLERLCRELNRNEATLQELVSVHRFYQSLIRRPRYWLDSVQTLLSRLWTRLRTS